MIESGITEAGSVQFPMVRHAAEVGWTPLMPQEALARRGGTSSMLFRGDLEAALCRFNPWMTADAVRSTIERLEALPPTIARPPRDLQTTRPDLRRGAQCLRGRCFLCR